MLWNCCIKFFSNNFDNEYQYLQPMDSNYMYYPTTNYQTTTSTTKIIAVEQPTKNTSTVFSNRKIISKPLKKKIQEININNITIFEEESENQTKHISL
ncbi:hypothetical protein [Spiroplasma endosymbiont of Tiphia femorata]|uniref:hypothetical protein n=1 Tax=Spiroplasma endosymbiont of Tiphia femorata TaxID=3066326 RepID=UPI001D679D9C|nr:hypothetical protein [Spiroplasma ixodetis]MBP1527047.1 hypothetical protein [Spiroplasma ixodetis]MBP1528245.1 hypothetical protein [Spiroplasma ixodetis]